MQTKDIECRLSAVQQLQSIRNRYQPGSYHFKKADYAIGLALSPARIANPFLVPNTLRDAAKILRRKTKHRPLILDLDAPLQADGEDGSEPLTLHDFVRSPVATPAEAYAVKDFLLHLAKRIGPKLSPARQVLYAMVNGDSADDFVRRTGFSKSYFKKLRLQIRMEALKLN